MSTSMPDPRSSTYRASDGAAYERFVGRWSRLLAGPFAGFAHVPEHGCVLDVGCGTGSLAITLAVRRQRDRVAGIDIALPYIAFARSRGAAVEFAVGDACRLPYADGSFVAALAQLSLNFVPDAAAAVREMRRVLAPGGVVAAPPRRFPPPPPPSPPSPAPPPPPTPPPPSRPPP